MSLLDTASEWNEKTTKKRVGTMKKILNKFEQTKEGFENVIPDNIKKTQETIDERNKRVSSLLDKMTSSEKEDTDGNNLANFEPLSNPEIQTKQDFPPIQQNNLKYNPNQHKLYSNYNNAYNEKLDYIQSAANNFSKNQMNVPNDKLMEKINYMIHMLEQQQHEKTENITEEFILYAFLGIFVIYVCDSFSRSGKYIR
tara:strand:+ start:19 stop:612 length:594 start_codon:yes stop_codon:yes gene_type:complete